MNVGELLRERDRLIAVIEEAKTARSRLRQLNVVIAMYGDDPKVSTNGTVPKSSRVTCAKCGESFAKQGIGVHNNRAHGGKVRIANG